MGQDNIIVWNVWGLNLYACWDVMRELVAAERPTFVCLQETKLNVFNDCDVLQLLGHGFDYAFLPSVQTRGDILIAWLCASWSVSSVSTGSYSITARVKHNGGGPEWCLTLFYGLTVGADKSTLLAELRMIRKYKPSPWLLSGNFNMIYIAKDKSNGRLDRRWMRQFHSFLNDVVLKEIHVNGKLYT
jgi:hypothetical protein